MPKQLRVGEFLPPYYISQLCNSIIISESFNFGDMRIIYAWALEIGGGYVSSYRMLFNIPYPANHQLKLLGFNKDEEPIAEANDMHNIPHWLQVFNPIVESFQNFGVEANDGKDGKSIRNRWGKPKPEPVGSGSGGLAGSDADDHFTLGPWLSAIVYLHGEGVMASGCLGDMKKYCKNRKLKMVVGIVMSCTPNLLGDMTVTLKDPTGIMGGTIHYKVFEKEDGYAKSIKVGFVLILRNVSVFTSKPSKHYLNITIRNIVKAFDNNTIF
nr:hypothetical protein [Tanacetum cinerariifolium]